LKNHGSHLGVACQIAHQIQSNFSKNGVDWLCNLAYALFVFFTNENKSRFTQLESFPQKIRVLKYKLINALAPICSFFFFLVRLVS
jgi:hypothetical protein